MITRLVIADDQAEFRYGLRALLSTVAGVRVVAEAVDGAAAIAACLRQRPDVVLMDIRMPNVDGIAATRELRRLLPLLRVLVLTTFHDEALVREAIVAGAAGYVLKDTPGDELGELIAMTRKGYAAFAPGVPFARVISGPPAEDAELAAKFAGLTERERAVLREIGNGATNRDIAQALFITEGTVKNYVTRILAQLGVRSRTEAALAARHLRP